MSIKTSIRALALGLALSLAGAAAMAQAITVERVQVHGASLEGNLEGNAVDRNVIVYLPPSYAKNPTRRYPVVYALHGYSIDNEKWTTEVKTPGTIEAAFGAGAKEMIVVLPDSRTVHNGSMYSSSVTTGDFENYVAHDVVAYIDSHYRTIARRESRGLAGHSMGGYGVVRIAMKHPDVFSVVYAMSACCLSPRGLPGQTEQLAALENIKTREEAEKGGWPVRTTFASAAAWSPNPDNPPFYLDLPTKGGVVQPQVLAKWAANAPLAMIDQYVGALRQYKAIAIDVGDKDGLKGDNDDLHAALDRYKIRHTYEVYSGTHTSAVADRMQNHVIPFFAANLVFPAN
jgi:enterochelin esterase-like enzyme